MSKILVEKYRPDNLDGFVGNDHIKNIISKFISGESRPHLLLSGPSGTGKTTLAKILYKNTDCDYIMINASDENGIETVREKIKGFCSNVSFKEIKLVVLDESDYLSPSAQSAMRYIIETYSTHTRFILTCNYVDRIISPIQSRCTVLNVIPPSKSTIAQHISNILDKEQIKYKPENIVAIVKNNFPDLRRMINNIQLFSNNGELILPETLTGNSAYSNNVIKLLTQSKPDWKEIRKTISSSNQSSFEDLYRELYDNIEKILPKNYGLGVVYLEQHQYQSQFSVDKEINIMSCITKLIELK